MSLKRGRSPKTDLWDPEVLRNWGDERKSANVTEAEI